MHTFICNFIFSLHFFVFSFSLRSEFNLLWTNCPLMKHDSNTLILSGIPRHRSLNSKPARVPLSLWFLSFCLFCTFPTQLYKMRLSRFKHANYIQGKICIKPKFQKMLVIMLLKGKSSSAGSTQFLHWKVRIFHHRCKRISGRFQVVSLIQDYTQCRDPLSMLLPLSFYSVKK